MKFKLSNLVWIVAIGLFVYFGATSKEFSSFLTEALEGVEPALESTGEFIGAVAEKIPDDANPASILNGILLTMSCVALVLSLLYRFLFKDTALKRDTYDEVKDLLLYSGASVLLSAFVQDEAHWWTLLAVPLCSYVLVYPLFYIPYYRFFKWVAAALYDLLVLIIGIFYISIYFGEYASLVTGILALFAIVFAGWFYWANRKHDHCPKCKRYVNIDRTGAEIADKRVDYSDHDEKVATQVMERYKIGKDGRKEVVDRTPVAWKRIKYTIKKTEIDYTVHLKCPYCGHEFTAREYDEKSKTLSYGERENG